MKRFISVYPCPWTTVNKRRVCLGKFGDSPTERRPPSSVSNLDNLDLSNSLCADYVPKRENYGVADSGVPIGGCGGPHGRYLDKGDTQERFLRHDDLQRDHKQRVDSGDRDWSV